MGRPERDLINHRLAGLAENERLFRANSGMGWTGDCVRKGEFMVIKNPRPFHGMPEGFPDLVGWTEITVTADMVGSKLAVFTCEEVKATGSLSRMQRRFRDVVTGMGGIWRVIKS